MSTVIGLFERWQDATAATARLKAMGYDGEALGVLVEQEAIKEQLGPGRREISADQEDSPVPAGAIGGLAIGELVGLLASAAVVAIPGIGQSLAAGAILAAGIGGGAVMGTIVGALVGMGADEERARLIAAEVRQGNTLVTLETTAAAALEAAKIMREADAKSVEIVEGLAGETPGAD